MTKDPLVLKAEIFCKAAHCAIGQTRKYVNSDYHYHPFAVRDILRETLGDALTVDMECAALLHDVLEDTKVKRRHILEEFNENIFRIVLGLTDVSDKTDGDRTVRKTIDRMHMAGQLPDVKTIKLADLIHNSMSIEKHDPGFAKIYMPEKKLMLDVLKEGDETLWKRARRIVHEYERKNQLKV